MKANQVETENRIYWTEEYNGLWTAHFKPKNPKTGKPWQAARQITALQNAYRLSNWETKAASEILLDNPPAFDVWKKEWKTITYGYSTEARAIAAIQAEIDK